MHSKTCLSVVKEKALRNKIPLVASVWGFDQLRRAYESCFEGTGLLSRLETGHPCILDEGSYVIEQTKLPTSLHSLKPMR